MNTHIATTQGLHAPSDYYSTFAAAAEAGALDGYSRYVQHVAAWLDDQVGGASGRGG